VGAQPLARPPQEIVDRIVAGDGFEAGRTMSL
jgi:hypothetical protein